MTSIRVQRGRARARIREKRQHHGRGRHRRPPRSSGNTKSGRRNLDSPRRSFTERTFREGTPDDTAERLDEIQHLTTKLLELSFSASKLALEAELAQFTAESHRMRNPQRHSIQLEHPPPPPTSPYRRVGAKQPYLLLKGKQYICIVKILYPLAFAPPMHTSFSLLFPWQAQDEEAPGPQPLRRHRRHPQQEQAAPLRRPRF